jgi:hypothetical protein
MVQKTNPDVGIAWWLIVQHDIAVKKSLVFDNTCLGKAPWTSITKPSLMEANSSSQRLATIGAHRADTSPGNPVRPALVEVDTSVNRSIIRSHGVGTSLDRSIHGKGTPAPAPDPCQLWNQDDLAVEIQWVYSELHLNVMEVIGFLRSSFMNDLKPRVRDIAHQYAGLVQQSMDQFKTWRLKQIHRKIYCQNWRCPQTRAEGVQDDYLGEVFKNTGWAHYENRISNELETRKTQRVARLMCFSRAAVGQHVGDCGASR